MDRSEIKRQIWELAKSDHETALRLLTKAHGYLAGTYERWASQAQAQGRPHELSDWLAAQARGSKGGVPAIVLSHVTAWAMTRAQGDPARMGQLVSLVATQGADFDWGRPRNKEEALKALDRFATERGI